MAVVSLMVDGRGTEEAAGDHNQHQEEELGLEGRYLIREIRTVGEIKLFLLLLLSGFCNLSGLMLLYYHCCCCY